MKGRKQRSDAAVAEILLDQLAIMRANVGGSIAGDDPDALHELRVALRRSRTLLKGMPGVFSPADHTRFEAEFKELQTITGPARDYDVLIEDLDDCTSARPELESESAALRKVLARKRTAAQNKLTRRLSSKRFADLLDAWEKTLDELPGASDEERPDASTPIGKLADARISADRKRFIELGIAALESGEPSAVHHTRKRGKSLRYNLEFFGHLRDAKRGKSMRHQLKKAQDELGAYQDSVTQETALRDAAESSDSVAAAIAAGAMIERAIAVREDRFEGFNARLRTLRRI